MSPRPRQYGARLPARPFQEWVEARIRFYERQESFGGEAYGGSDAVRRTAYDLGLDGRSLRRYRLGVSSTKKDGQTNEVPTETFSRDRVEELLWHAGVGLWEVYSDA